MRGPRSTRTRASSCSGRTCRAICGCRKLSSATRRGQKTSSSRASTWTWLLAPPPHWSARAAAARVHWSTCSCASTSPPRAASASTARTCAASRHAACARSAGSWPRTRSSSRSPSSRTWPTASTATTATRRWSRRAGRPTLTTSSWRPRRGTRPAWGSAACCSLGASASASRSPGASCAARGCSSWTRPPAPWTRRTSPWCRRPSTSSSPRRAAPWC
mmetsp:Transcript_41797/g.112280  ORF Transcript_41797/g.112280 Transcript_41797/m.112280 type:complete len:218 (+) Transcript_41797:1400-2053(+)